MAEPKDIVDFEALTPAVGDYLIVQRSASVGGKATVQAVVDAGIAAAVAAVPDASAPWPWVLNFDATAVTGPNSSAKSVTIPANTLSANGQALRVECIVSKATSLGEDDIYIIFGGIGLTGTSDGMASVESLRAWVIRTSASTMATIKDPSFAATATHGEALDWTAAQTLLVDLGTGVTIRMLRVVVEPG